jgi:electron transfer flavoprotein alpha subunit
VKILVYIEARDGALTADSLGLLAHAGAIGEVDAILCGRDIRVHAGTVSSYGASHVAVADDDSVADPLPQSHTDAIMSFLKERSYDAVFLSASILAADIAGGLSARLEAGVNSDLTGIEMRDGELVGYRPALGDSVVVEVGWTTSISISMFRPGVFLAEAPAPSQVTPEMIEVRVEPTPSSGLTSRIENAKRAASTTTSLAEASIIVAGGRGLGTKENLQLVLDLADALGGAAAVSMPLVSSGWAPYAMQIGQTGSVVRPKLYFACGISGQMQHKIGMERSGTIVAINTDASAPIFRFCDLAVVADAIEVLPKLIDLITKNNQEVVRQ